jgi:multiple sugar transport system permease protein
MATNELSLNTAGQRVKPRFSTRARPYLIVAPALLMLIGILYPFFTGVYYSYTNYTLTRPRFIFMGLKNYGLMLTDASFWNSTYATFAYAIGATSIEMVLGMIIALLLNRETGLSKALRTVLIMPMMIAPVIGTLLWKLMMQPSVGILPPALALIGIKNIEFAANPSTALPSVILIDVWIYTPFVALLILAGLQSLPREPFEAAKVDGASAWFTFRNLTLHMLTPIILIALTFRFMDSLKMYDVIYAMTGGGPGQTLMTYQLQSYYNGFLYMNLSYGLTYSIILFIIIYMVSQALILFWGKAQKRAAGL